jgi:uncharacterized membrane protein
MKESQRNLEAWMQKISLVTSLLSLGLMVSGFVDVLIHGASLSMPDMVALSPLAIGSGTRFPAGLAMMSAGIVLLSLLPILRVLLALSLYLWSRQVLNVLAALVVFIELLVSTRLGG